MKTHQCENVFCTNIAEKDKYGNYKRYCCTECRKVSQPSKMQESLAKKDMAAIAEKRRATVIAKYGVDNVSKTKAVKDKLRITTSATAVIRTAKTKATNLKNHGVESTNSLQSVKDKKKETFMEKYGVDHQLKIPGVAASVAKKNSDNAAERLAVAAQTKLEIYGDANYNNRKKYTETCLERFGVENPSQNAEVHAKKIKNSYKSKEYVLPSGNKIYLQGFEWLAMDELLETYNESEIITETSLIPIFDYTDIHGQSRKYFPDIYVPKDNLIIEVKSDWTYTQNKTVCDLKRDACVLSGYNFRFMIMKDK